jgi:hypothetical protein
MRKLTLLLLALALAGCGGSDESGSLSEESNSQADFARSLAALQNATVASQVAEAVATDNGGRFPAAAELAQEVQRLEPSLEVVVGTAKDACTATSSSQVYISGGGEQVKLASAGGGRVLVVKAPVAVGGQFSSNAVEFTCP